MRMVTEAGRATTGHTGRRLRSTAAEIGWPTVVATVALWVLLIPRMVPTGIDHGIFISVAERLLVGERLYVDVWDNKDPLFFYALALASIHRRAGRGCPDRVLIGLRGFGRG